MNITVYTRNNPPCAYCERAKSMLEYYGVDYNNKIIGEDISKENFLNEHPEIKTVPAIFFDDKFIGGALELEKEIWKIRPVRNIAL